MDRYISFWNTVHAKRGCKNACIRTLLMTLRLMGRRLSLRSVDFLFQPRLDSEGEKQTTPAFRGNEVPPVRRRAIFHAALLSCFDGCRHGATVVVPCHVPEVHRHERFSGCEEEDADDWSIHKKTVSTQETEGRLPSSTFQRSDVFRRSAWRPRDEVGDEKVMMLQR